METDDWRSQVFKLLEGVAAEVIEQVIEIVSEAAKDDIRWAYAYP